MYEMNHYEKGRLEAVRKVVEISVDANLDAEKGGELRITANPYGSYGNKYIVATDISDNRIGKVAKVDFNRAPYGDHFNYRVLWETMRDLLLTYGYRYVVVTYDANYQEPGMGESVLWFEKIVIGDEKQTTWEILGAKFHVIELEKRV